MNPVPGVLDKVDAFQQSRKPVAIAFAVNKKYGDDKGGYLAALITYYGFLSIFPLMLAFFTVSAWVIPPHGHTAQTLVKHLGKYPIIGQSIVQLTNHQLNGSALALIVGILGLIWGGQGLSQSMQYAMDEVYALPVRKRAGFVGRLVTGLKWYVTFGVGFIVATFVSSLGRIFDWGPAGPVLSSLLSLIINVGLFAVSFKVLAPKERGFRELIPGAVFAGVIWTILTGVGLGLLKTLSSTHNPAYAGFGTTIGLLAFLYLAARITLYAAEANVVVAKGLWPRSLRNAADTEADRQQLTDLARREERVDEEVVEVSFVEVPETPVAIDR